METLDVNTIARYVPEIVLVGLFMVYDLHRDKAWRDFLREQAAAYTLSIKDISDKLQQATGAINAITALLTAHDTRAQEFMRRESGDDSGSWKG